jgi:twitching motility protein PilT
MSSSNDKLIGRVALAARFISVEQLNEAVREHGRGSGSKNLGDILVELGFLTEARLKRVIELQKQVVQKAQAKSAARQPEPARPPAAAAGAETPAAMPIGALKLESAPPSSNVEAPKAGAAAPTSLDQLLRDAVDSGASDIHVHSGAPIKFRMRQKMYDHGSAPLGEDDARKLLYSCLTSEDRARFEAQGELDFCYPLEGVGRFRGNIYRQLRGIDGAFRFIPDTPPSLEDLGLPSALARFTSYHQGMVLLTGPTSCGKSSTMAALVNLINEERAEHILTIEDPIEYVHSSKRCVVNQRSVMRHTTSFARALRGALREDPDVIVIGELRDRETISLALSAAETGHFVLASLHTDNAVRTVNRLIGAFPPDQQEQVRAMLSESLKAVISQRLIPTIDESALVPALEIMVVSRAVGNLIREQKTVQIRSVLQTGTTQGMALLDNSLAELVNAGRITREEALRAAEDAKLIP